MNPSEIIFKRTQLLENRKFKDIYDLYSENSLLKRMYPDEENYSAFMSDFEKQVKIEKIQFLDETVKKNLAKVEYFEYISINGKRIVQYCVTYFKLFGDKWKITKENREIVRGQEE